MYSDKKPSARPLWVLAAAVALMLIILLAASRLPRKDLGQESAAAIRAAVERGAKQCYVVEGIYPPSLQYLEENYGLQINTRDFYVTYEAFASNLPPTVRVTAK